MDREAIRQAIKNLEKLGIDKPENHLRQTAVYSSSPSPFVIREEFYASLNLIGKEVGYSPKVLSVLDPISGG